jgi:Xaa-Pro aminopeptidase
MGNVLIVGDTLRMPELRHEVPLGIPDSFVYAELDGRRIVVIHAMEATRVEALGTGVEVHTIDEFGADELRKSGLTRYEFQTQLNVQIATGLGIERASVPERFPTGAADALRAAGIELRVDQKHFDDQRRRKSAHELAGIRRAQKAAEAAMDVARGMLARAEADGDALALDGEPLTCERVQEAIQTTLISHGAFGTDTIVSHGPQTAVGHEVGSGQIGANDVVLVDLFPFDVESGCFADMTRTYAIGDVDDEIRAWHALCLEALALATAAVGPGAHGGELHRLVSDFFSDRGFPTILTKRSGEALRDGFYHVLGHGVGLEAHESPSLGLIGDELVSGDVIALEPGLYRYGVGGVRVEDLLHVTDDGYELLTNCPYDLEVFP